MSAQGDMSEIVPGLVRGSERIHVEGLEAEIARLRHGLSLIVSESEQFPSEDGIGAGTMARNILAGDPSRGGVGYRPPTCATCGHPVGDHQSGRTSWPHPPRYGLCHAPGCDCRKFIDDNPETDARNYDAMRDEQAIHFGEVPEDTDFPFHRHADSGRDLAASRPVDPQAPPAFSSRSAALADTSTQPDVQRRAA